jgi:hypothetical protein
LDKAREHTNKASDIMNKASNFNVRTLNFSVEPQVNVVKFLNNVLETAKPRSRGSADAASASGPLIKPSEAPRLS